MGLVIRRASLSLHPHFLVPFCVMIMYSGTSLLWTHPWDSFECVLIKRVSSFLMTCDYNYVERFFPLSLSLYLSPSYRLRSPPETLDDLGNSLGLLEHLQTDIPKLEAQFEPLNDQFNILHKYEVPVPDEVEIQREGLQGSWMAFQQCLIDSDTMLKKHKVCIIN